MLKKISIFLLAMICLYTISACEVSNDKSKKLPSGTVTINNHVFAVEVAENDVTRAQGLSGRATLGEGKGMYFVFPTATVQSFWMKEMHFPLDMIWINDNQVVGVTADIPPPAAGTKLQDLKHYTSTQPANAVLELDVGSAAASHIQAGDKVIFSRAES